MKTRKIAATTYFAVFSIEIVSWLSLPISRQFWKPTNFAESSRPPWLKLSQSDQKTGTTRKARKGRKYGRMKR